ncbi:riboflavin synthase [Pleomorphomonas sp. JP5]|uniref:riboflavin synthase n=1 Tax=Pleomorphomonas sp. JP5 TaxID=2942998 RepID=UPI00204495A1|nr:riboflavin synthase [Pleomorphomonas sp. JP5]MCM5560228.1 riboflavin synthase [Pleomorphomonas sp. JP5]
MFSGIIARTVAVQTATATGGSLVVTIPTGWSDLELGESIAVNGVCLTVTEMDEDGTARFFLSPETLSRSNLGRLATGSVVNLERSVALADRLSGHMVQGHVDGKATLIAVTPDSDARRLEFDLPPELARYCVEKGSISLNGISLTINSIEPSDDGARIGITIIPHTWDNTNLSSAALGDEINVEVDVIAKYVEALCKPYLAH